MTGAAGFIGAAVCEALLHCDGEVLGVDNFTPYYDPSLKRARAARLGSSGAFHLVETDLADGGVTGDLVREYRPDVVIHLAAQPGVSQSSTDPMAYVHANVVASMNVLEACRRSGVGHLVYASSSSVYGAGGTLPFSIDDPADRPLSVYAATKRSVELLAHSYSHLFDLPTTGLRFFTVYGPWGRPDMAYYEFALRMAAGEPVTVYGDGTQRRDFTYVDDIVEGIVELAGRPPRCGAGCSPYKLLNLGHSEQVSVLRLIELLEEGLNTSAQIRYAPARLADVAATQADVTATRAELGFSPSTPVDVGVKEFTRWFTEYHQARP